MKEIDSHDFIENAENLLTGVAGNDDFLKIKTGAGNVILISESEWNIHVEAMKAVLTAK